MSDKVTKCSGTYRINDNVNKLQLSIHLKQINSLLKLPRFELKPFTAENWRGLETTTDTKEADEIQEVTIKWQEKILSAHEMEYYKESSNCSTEVQKRYHAWLRKGGGARVGEGTSNDMASDSQEMKPKPKLRKKGGKKEQRKRTETQTKDRTDITEVPIFTYINEDNHQPIADQRISAKDQPHSPPFTSSMYVYATLQSKDTLLITLHWNADERLLHIYPDFNDFHDSPYYIKIDADYCHLYAYAFRNTSPTAATEDAVSSKSGTKYNLQLPELLPTTRWQSEQQLAAEFSMPPKNSHRIVLLLEIREARDFEYDCLHVRYYVRLPVNIVVDEGLLQASTHTSAGKRGGTHHFGHCWQLSLLSDDCEDTNSLCHIFFEVISIDGWQRERVEGFAHCALALQATGAAVVSQHLRCLRPVDSFLDGINRFLIGGRQHFDFERFFLGEKTSTGASTDTSAASTIHNRYGSRMQQTGELLVSCHRLAQSNCKLMLQPGINRSGGMTLDDIMLAYREARKRLEEIVLN